MDAILMSFYSSDLTFQVTWIWNCNIIASTLSKRAFVLFLNPASNVNEFCNIEAVVEGELKGQKTYFPLSELAFWLWLY